MGSDVLITLIGLLIVFVGIVWLIVPSFRLGHSTTEKIVWSGTNLIFQPLARMIFFIVKRAGSIPLILVLIGFVRYGYGFNKLFGHIPCQ
ncbi:MAG: hypothetical protein R2747_13280 [Pyrinomonadaceae bacterium]